jgi:hypothetical protein
VQDYNAEEDVGITAHEADPAWFALEDHENCKVDNGGGECSTGTDEGAESHALENGVGVSLV